MLLGLLLWLVVLVFTPLPALIGGWAAAEQTQRERRLMDRWTKLYSRLNEVEGKFKFIRHLEKLEGRAIREDAVDVKLSIQ